MSFLSCAQNVYSQSGEDFVLEALLQAGAPRVAGAGFTCSL
jgi:hypothetical protein